MNIRKIFSPLIAIVIALLIYQSYNIYAENEPAEGVTEEMTSAGGEEGGGPLLPAEGTPAVPPAEEETPLPPVEATASVPSKDETAPLPPAEGTEPGPVVPVPVPMAPLIPPGAAPLALPGIEGARPLPPMEGTAPLPPAEATAPLPPAEGTAPPLIEIPVPVP